MAHSSKSWFSWFGLAQFLKKAAPIVADILPFGAYGYSAIVRKSMIFVSDEIVDQMRDKKIRWN